METVSKAIKELIISEPFYGIFASGLSRTWSTQVDHMGIVPDGINYKLLINKNYWYSLDKKHKIGLLKHNLLHLCLFHISEESENFRCLAQSNTILQTAFDCEVNSWIEQEYWPDDLSVKIFTALPNLPKCKGTKYYIDILNNLQNGILPETCQHVPGDTTEGLIEALHHEHIDHATWGNVHGQLVALRRTQLEYQLRTAAESISKDKIPVELKNIIDGLLTLKAPIFNWKKFFRNFLANACDFIPKSTRRKESLRFPGANGHKYGKKHNILIGVDTSGSISNKDLDEFFSEIYHVWKAGATVDIVEFDCQIQNQYHYKGKSPSSVKGRGGTDFREFVEYYNQNRKKYTVGICFTDGYASLNNINPANNFCWVISADGDQSQKYPGYKICIPKIIE